jgi:DNA-binding transcriptional LysR family regulator
MDEAGLKKKIVREADLALVTSPPSNAAITTVRIATNPFMLVLRENHPLAEKGSARLVEVAEYPWALFSRNVHPPLHLAHYANVSESRKISHCWLTQIRRYS